MIATNIKIYFYLCTLIFIFNFFTKVSSVKTYQVRRINDSTYLVTSIPYVDDVIYRKKSIKSIADSDRNKVNINAPAIHLDKKRKTTMKSYVFLTRGRPRNAGHDQHTAVKNIPSSQIMKAREDYFRKFYPSTLRPKITKHEITENLDEDAKLHTVKYQNDVTDNLQMARALAILLLNVRQEMDEKQVRKRRFVKKHNKNKKSQ